MGATGEREADRRAWTAVAAGVGVFVGLGAVGVASRGAPGDRTGAAFEASTDDRWLIGGFALAVVVATAVVVWAMWPDGRAKAERQPRSWWRHYVVSLVVLLLLIVVGSARERMLDGGRAPAQAVPDPAPAGPTDRGTGGDEGGMRPSALASVALGVVAISGVAAFAVLEAARRRHEQDDDGRHGVRDESTDATHRRTDAIDLTSLSAADVAAEPDPRRAVLLAYALLESRLAGTGIARAPAASPHEWLRLIRTHADAGTAGAAATLTGLFERARFSLRPLTNDDRDTAVAALLALDPLDAASTGPEPSTSTSGSRPAG